MTGVSLGFKNQWGCLGNMMSGTHHPRFASTLLAINKLSNRRSASRWHVLPRRKQVRWLVKQYPMNLVIAGDDLGPPTNYAAK